MKHTLGRKGMPEAETKRLAEYVMSFFGYTDEVIDNRLTSEDRDVFYMLEEEGFLTTTQEEILIKKGKLWRIHYWILKKDQILRMAKMAVAPPEAVDEAAKLYEGIAEEVWSQHVGGEPPAPRSSDDEEFPPSSSSQEKSEKT